LDKGPDGARGPAGMFGRTAVSMNMNGSRERVVRLCRDAARSWQGFGQPHVVRQLPQRLDPAPLVEQHPDPHRTSQ
ncbi:hypothetical protein AB0C69_39155, partial [Actinomadura sp. NPDC048032]|uniref:hypothetical protein n=1 Tax=Actinomadura sp. NPDC048032 TaxID=3155747 RepID=UPI0033C48294